MCLGLEDKSGGGQGGQQGGDMWRRAAPAAATCGEGWLRAAAGGPGGRGSGGSGVSTRGGKREREARTRANLGGRPRRPWRQ